MPRCADRLHARLVTALLLTAAALPAAQAQTGGSEQRSNLESLRPAGPVTLSADRAEWIQGGEMQYRGNVSLQSDTLRLRGDEMTVIQHEDGRIEARIVGRPARLTHSGRSDLSGPAAEAISAEAARIDYDMREGVVHLNGSARLQRASDEVTGELIDYVVAERHIRASGGQGGQVRIVIQPPPPTPTPEVRRQ